MTLNDLREYKATLEAARDDYENVKVIYTKENCPYRIGDRRKITGYSHNGKDMIITHLGVRESWVYSGQKDSGYEWIIRGAVLKKDGTPSKLSVCDNESVKGD